MTKKVHASKGSGAGRKQEREGRRRRANRSVPRGDSRLWHWVFVYGPDILRNGLFLVAFGVGVRASLLFMQRS